VARLGRCIDPKLQRIARWLERRPWNRRVTDKAWVLDSMWAALRFDQEMAQAERVRRR
jgi:hypothetical protein